MPMRWWPTTWPDGSWGASRESGFVAGAAANPCIFRTHRAPPHAVAPGTVYGGLCFAASSAIYLWGQNWLHTIVFGNYAGWAQLAYIALVYAWLCDLLFNRARISLQLCQGSMSGALSPC